MIKPPRTRLGRNGSRADGLLSCSQWGARWIRSGPGRSWNGGPVLFPDDRVIFRGFAGCLRSPFDAAWNKAVFGQWRGSRRCVDIEGRFDQHAPGAFGRGKAVEGVAAGSDGAVM